MRVEIDNNSGFCFGVVNAISKVEECISGGGRLVSLGDIVHNGAEVARLEALGLEVVPEKTPLSLLAGRRVLIRAHGEPPSTYRDAELHNIEIVDATCPVVARLQKTVADAYAKMSRVGGRVVIFGKRGHAEVRGLAGQVAGEVEIVENEADLEGLDYSKPIYFLAQTTNSLSEFYRLGEIIRGKIANPCALTVHDTVCRRVSGREEQLATLASRYDVVIFVAGAKSSNGRVLFEAVRGANPDSYKIESADELRPEWFHGKESVGVCGATSTPEWLMTEIADAILQIKL